VVAGERLLLVRRPAASVEARLTAGRLREGSVDVAGSLDGGLECGRLAAARARLRTLRLLFEAAEMAGACERVLEISVEHVRSRVQFDRPLATFQSVQHRMADMLTDLDGIRWMVARVAAELDAGREEVAAGLAVRLGIWTREASGRLVASAHQVHGGVGFIRDHPLHRYFGRQKSCELSFGRLSELRDLAAADLLGPA
jgi:alkylation response protein AidB-like acyl-CoA dehydrogenase